MKAQNKAEQFFESVLDCFKIDSFKAVGSMDMLLIVQDEWYNYLLETKEFGILKDIEGMDFFVCTTSKSGIAFKGNLNTDEIHRIDRFKEFYQCFYELDMNAQGSILEKFFPTT
ncbi:MAG: hypothetical protein P8I82_06070 [Flavobacteriales bacterium]|nr:hypothetical protein [Flavobacteriales bacterium]